MVRIETIVLMRQKIGPSAVQRILRAKKVSIKYPSKREFLYYMKHNTLSHHHFNIEEILKSRDNRKVASALSSELGKGHSSFLLKRFFSWHIESQTERLSDDNFLRLCSVFVRHSASSEVPRSARNQIFAMQGE
jgi:hypothetical protein